MGRLRLGDEVLAVWARDGFYYPAVLVHIDGTEAHVAYLDGDEAKVDLKTLRRGLIGIDTRVQINWKGKGRYYWGTVQRRLGQAIFLHYEDGSREWATIAQCRVHHEQVRQVGPSFHACIYCGASVDDQQRTCQSCGAPCNQD